MNNTSSPLFVKLNSDDLKKIDELVKERTDSRLTYFNQYRDINEIISYLKNK